MKKTIFSGSRESSSAFTSPSVIPLPVEMKVTGGVFNLTQDATIAYADQAARKPAERLAAQLRPATGFTLPVQSGDSGTILFKTQSDQELGAEGYRLDVADHILISAPSPAGLFYGSQTLRQLLPPEIYSNSVTPRDWGLPAVKICDVPRFLWRGLLLDVSRHFMPKEDVLRLIDTMASLKFNTFHWHLTDDQGWRIEIKRYPKLTEVGGWREGTLVGDLVDYRHRKVPFTYDGVRHGGFYTQDEVREIVGYARERHITIVPAIDMPGHMQAAVAAYPELGCTTERLDVMMEWGVSRNILNPEESTVAFCKAVLAEVMELFPSEFIHIGGDEVEKHHWENSERIRQLCAERGLKDMTEMQSWFIGQINGFLEANGRRMIGWDEIADGELPKNAAVMWWRADQGRQAVQAAAATGHDIVVAVSSHLYFDFYQSEDRKNEPLAIDGFTSLEKVYHVDPIFDGFNGPSARHVLGAQGQLWTEYIPAMKQVEYMAFPRACALAEVVWSPEETKNFSDFLVRMDVQEARFTEAQVNYRKIEKSSSRPCA